MKSPHMESIAPQTDKPFASLERGIAVTVNDRPVTISFSPGQLQQASEQEAIAAYVVERACGISFIATPGTRITYDTLSVTDTALQVCGNKLLGPDAKQNERDYVYTYLATLAALQRNPLGDMQTTFFYASVLLRGTSTMQSEVFQQMVELAKTDPTQLVVRLNTLAEYIDLVNLEHFFTALTIEFPKQAQAQAKGDAYAVVPVPTWKYVVGECGQCIIGRPDFIREVQFRTVSNICTYPEHLANCLLTYHELLQVQIYNGDLASPAT